MPVSSVVKIISLRCCRRPGALLHGPKAKCNCASGRQRVNSLTILQTGMK